jgi:COP9 signalosome complex subunit 6
VRLVHSQPQLELVGWATLVPGTGPTDDHLPIHSQLLRNYNDSAILLGFHPEKVFAPVGAKLPITLYDSSWVVEEREDRASEDEPMRDDDTSPAQRASKPEPKAHLTFHELPYSVETGEAEMIGMQFVHRGAANASARANAEKKASQTEMGGKGKGKGKGKSVARPEPQADTEAQVSDVLALTNEESDLIAALSSRRNAIQMLKKRIDLFIVYLQRLPSATKRSDHANDAISSVQELASLPSTAPSNTILRAIQALKTNLALLALTNPSAAPRENAHMAPQSHSESTFETEMLREANDVHLVSLLADVLQSLDQVREVGSHFSVVEGARAQRGPRMMGESGVHTSSGIGGDLAHMLH